jgi:nitrate reductase gamma subunit
MGFLTIFFALFFYLATIVLVAGVAYRIYEYARTPAPLKVPTMPAPLTRGGVALRLLGEVVLFRSLFRANKWIWLFGMLFHFGMLLVLLRHFRYFVDLNNIIWFWVALIQPFGKYASFAMLIGMMGLLGRRIVVERIRYISNPSDYLMLVLLIFIAATGMLMTFVIPIDIDAFKAFTQGLLTFSWSTLPANPVLLLHLTSVFLLMLIFPISKLLHAPGVFFSPSRNQVDNSREKRHLAPWAAKLEK